MSKTVTIIIKNLDSWKIQIFLLSTVLARVKIPRNNFAFENDNRLLRKDTRLLISSLYSNLFLTLYLYMAEYTRRYARRIDATSSFAAFYFLSLASLSYGRGRRQRI